MADTQLTALKRYTPAELAAGDGKEGRPALFVYRGKVYDVTGSKLWRNGKHVNAHFAGNDLTRSMPAAPHDEDVLVKFPVIGLLVEEEEAKLRLPPRIFQLVLDRHPHPISVHFPIALGLVAALFTFLALCSSATATAQLFHAVAFYNLLICAIGTPPAIATGLLSWYYNYAAVWTPIYRWKVSLSILLVVLALITLALRLLVPATMETGSLVYWTYSLLVIALGPTVIGLGYFGGKITFPA